MNFGKIIKALRVRCPTFVNRVAGAAEFKDLRGKANLLVPSAYVVPLDETAEDQTSENGYRQTLRESFAVIVILDNQVDERGQSAVSHLDAIRLELWRALLGWCLDDDVSPASARCYHPIEYEGGNVLDVTREALFYQFEFACDFSMGVEHTYQKIDLDASPAFETVSIKVVPLDPSAPTPPPGEEVVPTAEVLIEVPQ